MLRLPDVQQRFADQGAEPVGNTPDDMGRFVAGEVVRWRKVIRDARVVMD